MKENSPNKSLGELDKKCLEFSTKRKTPLCVMYYSDYGGSMNADDIRDLYDEFRERGIDKDHRIEKVDILLHTIGGDPDAAYMLAQVVRSMADYVNIIVPEYAYSAGTLFSMCGNRIFLGDYASLSPIDITLVSNDERDKDVELVNIDYYLQFATRSLKEVLDTHKSANSNSGSNVANDLLVEMVRQMGAHDIGKFYRSRTLTGHYARRLLGDYMFRDQPNRRTLINEIVDQILFGLPSHEFMMDYSICSGLGLAVNKLDTDLFDQTHEILDTIGNLTRGGLVCKEAENNYRVPYFRLYMEAPKNDASGKQKES